MIPHLTVLSRDTNDAFDFRVVPEIFNNRRHFDGFGASAEDGNYLHEFVLLRPKRACHLPENLQQPPAKTLLKTILAKGAASALTEYRESRKARAGNEVLDEGQMNQLGYDLLSARRIKDAIEIFKQNVEDYPKSSNVYDSLGDAYARDGQTELAVKN